MDRSVAPPLASASMPDRRALRQTSNRGVEFMTVHLADALIAGDEDRARAVFDRASELGFTIAEVHRDIVAPAAFRVADQVVSGRISAAEEQRSAELCMIVLRRFTEATAGRAAPGSALALIALVAVEPQRHVLGMRMVADLLNSEGYDARCFGPQLPASALRAVVASIRPDVVCLSWETPGSVSALADAIMQVHEASADARIMLSGRAVPPALWESGYPRVLTSAEVVEVVEDLLAAPSRPAAAVVAGLRGPASA